MPNTQEYNLYLASWEHLYLVPGGTPAGLPNQLFSRHPWALVLFETLYCDENGLKGEQAGAARMGWTNSRLFVTLASREHQIIQPLPVQPQLQLYGSATRQNFANAHGLSMEEAISADNPVLDEMVFTQWRLELLSPFLRDRRLVLYDWPVARVSGGIPVALQSAAKDVLGFEVAEVPLARDVFTDLSPARRAIFDDLQAFEREPLRALRAGRLGQDPYLTVLEQRIHDHREVDMELAQGIDQRLDQILRMRERFGRRGGWAAVRDFLQAYDRAASVDELNELDRKVRDRLRYCFLPVWSEFSHATAHIMQGLAKLLPVVHEGHVAMEVARGVSEATKPMKDFWNYFFRGRGRGQKG